MSIEGGEATAEPTAKATTGSPTTTTPATIAPDPLSDAIAGLEETGQVGAGKEGGEEVDLSDLMTLLFQHLRTDEGRAEFQALVEAEEVKAAAAAEIVEKKEENEGEEGSGEMNEGDEEKREPPVVK
jgi:TATA-binding protein-associated factor Taf7